MATEPTAEQVARDVGLRYAVNELAAAVAGLAAGSPDAAEHATQAQLHLDAAEILAQAARQTPRA